MICESTVYVSSGSDFTPKPILHHDWICIHFLKHASLRLLWNSYKLWANLTEWVVSRQSYFSIITYQWSVLCGPWWQLVLLTLSPGGIFYYDSSDSGSVGSVTEAYGSDVSVTEKQFRVICYRPSSQCSHIIFFCTNPCDQNNSLAPFMEWESSL